MKNGVVLTLLAASMTLLSGCSPDPDSEKKASTESDKAVVTSTTTAVANVASAEPASEPVTSPPAQPGNGSLAANAPTDAVATETPAETAMPKIRKDDAGNPIITAAVLDSAAASSRNIVKTFGTTLKGELQSAMTAGGPESAMDVCNVRAPEIADKVGQDANAKVYRVSLKNRNPSGAPSSWEERVLKDFDTRNLAGEDKKSLEYTEVVEIDGKNQFRFVKAIPTEAMCLQCHGSDISQAVQAKLSELYPNDKAVGYKEGDIRGAFVVLQNFEVE